MARYLFPRWSNKVLPILIFWVLGPLGTAGIAAAVYYTPNENVNVGYAPKQPVQYSHKLHAGELGIDCRYCHSPAERGAMATVPPTQVCMNCHTKIRPDSVKLLPVRESAATGMPIKWRRVHNAPDYVYFDHSVHLAANVGCVECHGRIDQQETVTQTKSLSMTFCLECHRDPAPRLRPAGVSVTQMDWKPNTNASDPSKAAVAANGRTVYPPTHCSGCHR
jgi:hypothetical protein